MIGPGAAGSATPSTVAIGCTSRTVDRGTLRRHVCNDSTGTSCCSIEMPSSPLPTSRRSWRVTPLRQPADSGGVHALLVRGRGTRWSRSPRRGFPACWRRSPRPRRVPRRTRARARSRRRRSSSAPRARRLRCATRARHHDVGSGRGGSSWERHDDDGRRNRRRGASRAALRTAGHRDAQPRFAQGRWRRARDSAAARSSAGVGGDEAESVRRRRASVRGAGSTRTARRRRRAVSRTRRRRRRGRDRAATRRAASSGVSSPFIQMITSLTPAHWLLALTGLRVVAPAAASRRAAFNSVSAIHSSGSGVGNDAAADAEMRFGRRRS